MAQEPIYYFVKEKKVISGPYTVQQLTAMLNRKFLTPRSPVSANKVQWENLQEVLRRHHIDLAMLSVPVEPEEEAEPTLVLPEVPDGKEDYGIRPSPSSSPSPFADAVLISEPARQAPAVPDAEAKTAAGTSALWERVFRLIWIPDAERSSFSGEEGKAVLAALIYSLSAAVLTGWLRVQFHYSPVLFRTAVLQRLGSVVQGAVLAMLAAAVFSLLPSEHPEKHHRFFPDALTLFMQLSTLFLTFAALWPVPPFRMDWKNLLAAQVLLVMFTFFSVSIAAFFQSRFPSEKGRGLTRWGAVYFVFAAAAVHYGYLFLLKEF